MSLFSSIPTAEIRKNLWLSSELSGCHGSRVKNNNIKVIVSMNHSETLHVSKVPDVQYHLIRLMDADLDDVLIRFPLVHKIIDEALAQDKAVMLMSPFGRSRSVAPVIGYLMKTENLTYEQAYQACKQKRDFIGLHPEFHAQLALYEVMKCDMSMNNLWMKRYFLKQLSRAKQDPYFEFDIPNYVAHARQNFVKDPAASKPDPESMYQCKSCKHPLFAINDVVGEDYLFLSECRSVCTVATEWLMQDDRCAMDKYGPIHCPGCSLELGEFDWCHSKRNRVFHFKVNFEGEQFFTLKVPLVFCFEKPKIIVPINYM